MYLFSIGFKNCFSVLLYFKNQSKIKTKDHMSVPKRYTITAALPYTNGPIHIGHLAGVYVPADIYARYLRLTGNDVAYISGSDEHGAAIPMRAKKEGVSPQVIIDKYHGIIKQSFADFGISFDNFMIFVDNDLRRNTFFFGFHWYCSTMFIRTRNICNIVTR